MRCNKCGADIREGSLYCEICGEEVRIVPDYSSLDEVLAAHVRGEIELEQRRKASARRRRRIRQDEQRKKKMLIILGTMLLAMLIGFIAYQGSYAGKIQKGYNALEKENYNAAIRYFTSASEDNNEKADAYIGLAEVYIQKDDLFAAENIFLAQIEEQQSNADIYKAAAEFYLETRQPEKIPLMLDACKDEKVLSAMGEYIVEEPAFSLMEGTYEETQRLELAAGTYMVYYTLDETEPSEKTGTKYGTDIMLQEGNWTVKAVAVNERGIPSLITEKKFTIEYPAADPPIVYPSTGLYESQMDITIQTKKGFTAYYIFGDTELTVENGKKYTGPIKMPEGNNIFSAILVDDMTGRVSGTTVRNYDLQLVSGDEANGQ